MATYTVAGLQAELTAYETAFTNRDWDTALTELNSYAVTHAGLFSKGGLDGASIEFPDPKQLLENFQKLRELALIMGSDTRRVMVGRTSFGVPGG